MHIRIFMQFQIIFKKFLELLLKLNQSEIINNHMPIVQTKCFKNYQILARFPGNVYFRIFLQLFNFVTEK